MIEESRLTVLFDGVAAATEQRRFPDALRLADSARRLAPEHPTANLVFARALLQNGAARAAVAALQGREDVESRVLRLEAADRAGLTQVALDICERLLASVAVDAIPAILPAVSGLWRKHGDRHPGWVGIDSTLRLVGEAPAGAVALIEQGGESLGHVSPAGSAGAPASFARPVPPAAGALTVRVGARELLGSKLPWPPDFGLTGWVVLEGRHLRGEVGMNWNPRAPVTLVVTQGERVERFQVERPATDAGELWPFEIEIGTAAADVGVAAMLPDGSSMALAGSPLPRVQPPAAPVADPPPRAVRRMNKAARARLDAILPPRVNIVVPVYAGPEETLVCLRSVLATTPATLGTITVVDDATPDPRLRAALDELAAEGCITLIRNETNLGFPGAVNRGAAAFPERDLVLLNADTEVFDGWLERLQSAAYAHDAIGTATPLGEASSITSYPGSGARPYTSAEAAAIDRIARQVNEGKAIDIPVGVGFCLYVRRRCLDEVGEFDEQGFGKGYGEENDFCLRARRRGWRHVAATGLFVRHAGARSFGRTKQLLTARNRRVINYRHPGYDELIAEFVAADSLRESKRGIDCRRLLDGAVRPALLVSLDLPGGVKRHVAARESALAGEGHTVLTLRADSRPEHVGRLQIAVLSPAAVAGGGFEHLVFDLPREAQTLRDLLLELNLQRIEIHHFLGLPGAALDMIAGLGASYEVFIHDYAWICPRLSFLDGEGRYCGEPALAACEACVQKNGSAFKEAMTVTTLRARSQRILENAARVVAPTQDVRERFARYFPALRIGVTPWERIGETTRESTREQLPGAGDRPRGTVRALLMGGINTQKGYAVLLACARDAAARALPLEFVVVGFTRDDQALIDTGRVFITGPYEESEAGALLQRERADIALFPTVGPETWCYTLTHVLSQQLPVVAFDLGAVAERLRAAATGLLLPPAASPQVINDTLLRYAADTAVTLRKPANGHNGAMSSAPPAPQPAAANPAAAAIASSVQVLNLPAGIYAFTVQGGGAAGAGELSLPALQVTPAPIRTAAVIEFLCGPKTHDRWLTGPGDVVTVKISGGSAALLLTSLRAADSSVLSIDVRRLDAVSEAPAAAAPAPAAVPTLAAVPILAAAPAPATGAAGQPRITTLVHVPYLGDLEFQDGWAGRPAENLWIEGFALASASGDPDLLEYCGITEAGYETGWLDRGELCGTRGSGTPLVAFAVRLKPGAAGQYVCRYSGRFLSGVTVGPLSSGFCRSESPGDPLVGIELTVSPGG